MDSLTLTPIGIVHSTRTRPTDDNWDAEQSHIALDPAQFSPDSLTGIETFSHVEILFQMHDIPPEKINAAARHPRNNPNWPKVGIFAQRGKNRPNRIGATICKIKKVDGLQLHVEGLDAIDGSPVLDIKPWVIEFAPRGQVFQPSWISELMREYWHSP